jgi:hypothetical protein
VYTKICELCSKEFGCNPNTSEYDVCWCQKLPIVTSQIPTKDCVCIQCLREIHDKETRTTV